jgi:hypothetical protein
MPTLTRKPDPLTTFEQQRAKVIADLAVEHERFDRISTELAELLFTDGDTSREQANLLADRKAIAERIADLDRALEAADAIRRRAASAGATAEFDRLAAERADYARELRRTWATLEEQAAELLATNLRLTRLAELDRTAMVAQGRAVSDGALDRDVHPAPSGIGLAFQRGDLPSEIAAARVAFEAGLRGR